MKLAAITILAMALTGCIATAPVSVAWRSNTHQQYATTEGKTDSKAGHDTVNAEKTTNAEAAVSTSSGTANAIKSNPEATGKTGDHGNSDNGGEAK